ncbi:MAG: hypothetical protein ACRC8C_01430 [Mycoplasmoidaceae bacterium]
MKNKKSLGLAISLAVLFIALTIVGSAFCNWALYLIPIAFIPIAMWTIRNWKNLSTSLKNKKNIIK